MAPRCNGGHYHVTAYPLSLRHSDLILLCTCLRRLTLQFVDIPANNFINVKSVFASELDGTFIYKKLTVTRFRFFTRFYTNMSSSDEESDQLMDLEAIRDQMLTQKNERMQVSAWEDDDDGVDADRNAKEPDEKKVLGAAEDGNLEKLKKLLIKNPSLLECKDKDGYTPLHRACYGNHVQIVEFLLQAGANIDSKTMDGWQPLHSACCWNNVECAAILIRHGADVNARSKGDQTPLHLASASSHNSPCLQLFLLHPDTDHTLVNSSGDTAEQIAKRTGKYYPLFEITEDCLNVI